MIGKAATGISSSLRKTLRSLRKPLGRFIGVSAVAGGFLIHTLPHTLYIDSYKNFTQFNKQGFPVKPSDHVQALFESAMNDLQFSKDRQNQVSLYTCFGFDNLHIGSLSFWNKALLGLPEFFKFQKPEDVTPQNIRIRNEPVNWGSPEAQSLRKSLILSDDAKKFAIARDLVRLQTAEPFVYGLCLASEFLVLWGILSIKSKKHPILMKLFYAVMAVVTFSIGSACTNLLQVMYEGDADKAAANISENYAKGGLEFYENVLRRNMCLRRLMGTSGESWYTAYGNDQVLFLTKHIPFTVRRDFFKSRVEEYQKAADSDSKEESS